MVSLEISLTYRNISGKLIDLVYFYFYLPFCQNYHFNVDINYEVSSYRKLFVTLILLEIFLFYKICFYF